MEKRLDCELDGVRVVFDDEYVVGDDCGLEACRVEDRDEVPYGCALLKL